MLDPKVDVDEIWRGLGKWGTYQKFQIGISLINIWPTGFHLFSVVFLGFRTSFQCNEVKDESQYLHKVHDSNASYYMNYGKCAVDIFVNTTNGSSLASQLACPNGYSYPVPKGRSFVTEWDLVCDDASYAALTQTLVIIGQAVGAATTSPLADRYGRKTVAVISHIGIFAIGLTTTFIPMYSGFAVLRFLVGVFQQGMVLTSAIIKLEMVPRENRYWTLVLSGLVWSMGLIVATPVAYLLRNQSWRYFQLTITLFSVYSLIQYWIQDESLRWLLINGKMKEAERIVRKAAKWNKVEYDDVIDYVQKKMTEKNQIVSNGNTKSRHEKDSGIESEDLLPQQSATDSVELAMASKPNAPFMIEREKGEEFKVEHYTILTLLTERRIFVISLILWFTWITNSLTYFGLVLTSGSLTGSRFLNFFLNAAVEFPATFLQYYCTNRYGRKFTCIMFHLIAGISLIVATVLSYFGSSNNTMMIFATVFTLLGKLGISGSFGTIFLYTPELYPTNLRNAGIGFSSSASRLGGMLSPFAGTLATYIPWAPGTIFSAMCMIVSGLFLYLPETSGHELPQTMEEVRVWYKDHSGVVNRRKTEEQKSSV